MLALCNVRPRESKKKNYHRKRTIHIFLLHPHTRCHEDKNIYIVHSISRIFSQLFTSLAVSFARYVAFPFSSSSLFLLLYRFWSLWTFHEILHINLFIFNALKRFRSVYAWAIAQIVCCVWLFSLFRSFVRSMVWLVHLFFSHRNSKRNRFRNHSLNIREIE